MTSSNSNSSEICSICIEEVDKQSVIATPCKHKFHKDCIKNICTASCPVCRKNIFWFLIRNKIIKKNEIIKRQNERKEEIMIQEYNSYVESVDIDDEDIETFMEKSLNSYLLKLPMSICAYKNILCDQIRNSADLYWQISQKMYKSKKAGVFFYKFTDVVRTIVYFGNKSNKSIAQWHCLNKFKGKTKDLIKPLCDTVKDSSHEFAVVIMWDLEEIEFCLLSLMKFSNKVGKRPIYLDILRSMRLGENIRSDSETDYLEPNRELQWAKKYLRKLGGSTVRKPVDVDMDWFHKSGVAQI